MPALLVDLLTQIHPAGMALVARHVAMMHAAVKVSSITAIGDTGRAACLHLFWLPAATARVPWPVGTHSARTELWTVDKPQKQPYSHQIRL
jgi:hypothetical protein